ncbi:conserved protein of unknown function [Tepidanaerobacter acetatoxydans Re1]|uniref:Uncharacterized protein n=1 Tax=Tepidanaerobacter acetatoxydans (strain DSM 21804 / JCM 16047 / Re1) TaxID=1209989 RepID=F4LS20_TEPAE|nr:hypothetical protein TepRe1_2237 [Tepidanaerobacter acetatoxydans Re1]CCP27248.1 conserved protein of unknown function [Tepidanaerobacter acetatoxydans Re1]
MSGNSFLDYIEFNKARKVQFKVEDVTLASEKSLSKDWLNLKVIFL